LIIKERGTTKILTELDKLVRELPSIEEDVLSEYAVIIMSESYSQVPVDTSSLRDSNFIKTPKTTAEGVFIEFGYGDKMVKINPKTEELTTTYAIRVHEDLNMRHPRGGKALFLSDPVYDNLANILKVLKLQTLKLFKR
jgi:hypothetical protein